MAWAPVVGSARLSAGSTRAQPAAPFSRGGLLSRFAIPPS
eukprot:CAMPEP_0181199422 /NCGR_PEP_ID=MMETSP1096-20121128/17164_1 /TAXON_ID=156174 ORGANISM="Chrysochromulina ericina, Strain CCMP281" /NCGR_SAMPLE_ID=MMETSP1096 /ASSEMBLY_ACC=CAM_ASM_000453 /LENGTH=39 /DNA_ID= /DNA_START= /DNA_END= /DNA_ORIENTATION=